MHLNILYFAQNRRQINLLRWLGSVHWGLSHGRSVRTSYFTIALDAILCSLSCLIHTQPSVGIRGGTGERFDNSATKTTGNLHSIYLNKVPWHFPQIMTFFLFDLVNFVPRFEPVGVCVGKEAERRSFKKGRQKSRRLRLTRFPTFRHIKTFFVVLCVCLCVGL